MAGRKLYFNNEQGGIEFRSNRKIGDVRIQNYVYDIWLPLLGATSIGVYGVYCRLERNGSVKGLNQSKLAKMCRVGTRKLAEINEQLADCGFITVRKPQGYEKLMHYTTQITVEDPPQTASKKLQDKYAPPSGYEILTPWLQSESTELSNGNADDSDQKCDALSGENANFASLGLQPLDLEQGSAEPTYEPKPEPPSGNDDGPSPPVKAPLAVEDQLPVCGPPTSFRGWLDRLRSNGNGPAVLVDMHAHLYPDRDPPSFSYVGRVGRKLGNERLAELLWQNSTRPPVGDVLAYVQGMVRNQRQRGDQNDDVLAQTRKRWLGDGDEDGPVVEGRARVREVVL
jgi:hypothetical protein